MHSKLQFLPEAKKKFDQSNSIGSDDEEVLHCLLTAVGLRLDRKLEEDYRRYPLLVHLHPPSTHRQIEPHPKWATEEG